MFVSLCDHGTSGFPVRVVLFVHCSELKELDSNALFHVNPVDEGSYQHLLNYKAMILGPCFDHVLRARNSLFKYVLMPFLFVSDISLVLCLLVFQGKFHLFSSRFNKDLLKEVEAGVNRAQSLLCKDCNHDVIVELNNLAGHAYQLAKLMEDVLESL